MLCACMYTFIIVYVCVLLLELFTTKTTRCIQMESFDKAINKLYTPECAPRGIKGIWSVLIRTVSRCDHALEHVSKRWGGESFSLEEVCSRLRGAHCGGKWAGDFFSRRGQVSTKRPPFSSPHDPKPLGESRVSGPGPTQLQASAHHPQAEPNPGSQCLPWWHDRMSQLWLPWQRAMDQSA